jgi:hypothetical protein
MSFRRVSWSSMFVVPWLNLGQQGARPHATYGGDKSVGLPIARQARGARVSFPVPGP